MKSNRGKRKTESRQAICAIVSRSYLAHARNMIASYQKHNPGSPAYVLVFDSSREDLSRLSEPFTMVSADEMAAYFPDFRELAFKYTAFELACALKPYFLIYVFEKYRLESALYVDSDIQFYSSIKGLHAHLSSNSIVLIPHTVKATESPAKQSQLHNELLLLLSGSYNAGVIGVRASDSGKRFLTWWKDRLSQECAISRAHGLYHDQRWLDLAPGLFDGVYIERSEEYNVAFWNLHEREIKIRARKYLCGKKPLAFFHFSHVDIEHSKGINKAWALRKVAPSPAVRKLISEYRESLLQKGYAEASKTLYRFENFDNGVAIPKQARRLYQRVSRERSFEDPFKTQSKTSFYRWMLKSSRGKPSPLALELMNSTSSKADLDPKLIAELSKGSKNR